MAHEHGSIARREPGPSVGMIARGHGERVRAEHVLSPEQHQVPRAIERCGTAALGGHLHAPRDGLQPNLTEAARSLQKKTAPVAIRWKGQPGVKFTSSQPANAPPSLTARVPAGQLLASVSPASRETVAN